MLVMLMPDQVMRYWDLVKEGLEETLPPYVTNSPNKMEDIQMGLLIGKAQCWLFINNEPTVKCVVITRTIHDDLTDSEIFEITSLRSFNKILGEEWVEGFETIKKYAYGCKCDKIVFYSDNEIMLKITGKLGFKPTYVYSEYLLPGVTNENTY